MAIAMAFARSAASRVKRCVWQDVEGSEHMVIESLDFSHLSLGVLIVEVRGDGQRAPIMKSLLGQGMSYVGQLVVRKTTMNDIFDDVFVNTTHLRKHFPQSRALAGSGCPTACGAHNPQWYPIFHGNPFEAAG